MFGGLVNVGNYSDFIYVFIYLFLFLFIYLFILIYLYLFIYFYLFIFIYFFFWGGVICTMFIIFITLNVRFIKSKEQNCLID